MHVGLLNTVCLLKEYDAKLQEELSQTTFSKTINNCTLFTLSFHFEHIWQQLIITY